jgi:hypothetical protein
MKNIQLYEEGKTSLAAVRKYRTDLEKKRQEIKAPALAYGKLIDSEAKRITAELLKIEEPLSEAKKVIDDEKKRRKAAVIERIEAKIQHIKDIPMNSMNSTVEEIEQLIADLKDDECLDCGELTSRALIARTNTTLQLESIRDQKVIAKAEAEQAEIDRIEREKAEAELAEQREAMAKQQREMDERQAKLQAEEHQRQAAIKAEEEAKLKAEQQAKFEAEAKERAEIEARERLEREEAERKAAEEKAAEEARIKAEQATDKEKLQASFDKMNKVPVLSLQSKSAQLTWLEFLEKYEILLQNLESQIEAL